MKAIPLVAAFIVSAIPGASAQTQVEPAAQANAAAFNHFYNLDYETATKEFREFAHAHPDSAEAWNNLAQGIFYSAMFECGIMGSDLVKTNEAVMHSAKVVLTPEREAEMQGALAKAQAVAEASLKANPRDPMALYALGVTYAMRANYELLSKHAWLSGLRAANESRKLHEQVIKLDPSNFDARLVPGTHQYMVGTLPLIARLAARAAGVTGDRVAGLKKVELTAAKGETAKLDAQILLAVLYRREHRSQDGIPIMTKMTEAYPGNFVFRIELAKLYADTGDRPHAAAEVDEINQLIADRAPGYCGSRVAMIRRQESEVGEQIAQLPQATPELASAGGGRPLPHANLLK